MHIYIYICIYTYLYIVFFCLDLIDNLPFRAVAVPLFQLTQVSCAPAALNENFAVLKDAWTGNWLAEKAPGKNMVNWEHSRSLGIVDNEE